MRTKLMTVAIIGIAIMTGMASAAVIAPVAAVSNTYFGENHGADWGNAGQLADAGRVVSNQFTPGGWNTNYLAKDNWGTWENWVYIDLGAEYDLDEISIWNITDNDPVNNLTGRGVKASSLWVAGEGAALPVSNVSGFAIDGDGSAKFSGWTNFWAGDLTVGADATDPVVPLNASDVFDASSLTGVRYVGLDINPTFSLRGVKGGL